MEKIDERKKYDRIPFSDRCYDRGQSLFTDKQ